MTALDDITRRPFATPSDEAKAGDGLAAWCLALGALAMCALGGVVWSVVR